MRPGHFDPGKSHLKQRLLDWLVKDVSLDDWMDFAESKCHPRPKKYCKQSDLKDIGTQVWAEAQGGVSGYKDWVRGVLESGRAGGEVYLVGNLPAHVCNHLKVQARLSLVVMDDISVLHSTREAKSARGSALTWDEMASISERFADGEWLRNAKDDAILMCWQRLGEVWLKIVLKLERRIGHGTSHHIITCGVVARHNLDEPHIIKIGS